MSRKKSLSLNVEWDGRVGRRDYKSSEEGR